MTTLPTIDPAAVASVAGIVVILGQVILTTGNSTADASNRWGPILAVVLGVVVAEVGIVAGGSPTPALLSTGLLTGLAAGLSAMGVHNVATKSVVGTGVATALGIGTPAPLPPATQ